MPTASISLPDGTAWTLTWDTTPVVPPVPDTSAPPATYVPESPPEPLTSTSSDVVTPTPEDVKAALAKVPPRWMATALRAGKTFVAGMAAAIAVAWATTGGSWEGLARDPSAFLTALVTALVMGAWKFAKWRE